MAMEDDESWGSRAVDSSPKQNRQDGQRLEVFNEVLTRLQHLNHQDANLPGFEDQLWLHFNRLPPRYALDVNVERAEDVLTHKRLLHLAEDPAARPVFEVRLVQEPVVSRNPLSSLLLADDKDGLPCKDKENPALRTPEHGNNNRELKDEAVEGGGNTAKAAGDQVLQTSSFFGHELWPVDKLGFTKTVIQAKPDSVYFVVSRFWLSKIGDLRWKLTCNNSNYGHIWLCCSRIHCNRVVHRLFCNAI